MAAVLLAGGVWLICGQTVWKYQNVSVISVLYRGEIPYSLTRDQRNTLCDLLENTEKREISDEELRSCSGLNGGYWEVSYTCGGVRYEWTIGCYKNAFTCTVTPLLGKETTVYYYSEELYASVILMLGLL